jgi:phosphoribosylformylglycinamidine cyclo-ligase
MTYAASGVDTDAAAVGLSGLLSWVRRTAAFREGVGEPQVPIGFFANVIRIADGVSVAISTDGVGSKSAVAQLAGRYEEVGWDCVAVNVNDVICAGAEPVALVDYVSLQFPHEELLSQLGKGMHDGAARARVAIVGGELSQHPDTLRGPREGYAFDLSGTCIGVLQGRDAITGGSIGPGDVVLGLASNGIHANGMTLARRVLLADGTDRYLEACGRTVLDELLRPTHIYVPEALALLGSDVEVKGLAHISGGGLLNLTRLEAPVGYEIDSLLDVPPVFDAIAAEGRVGDEEMFRVFNMGVGFCVVVAEASADAAMRVVAGAGGTARRIGRVTGGPVGQVTVPRRGLVGRDGRFERA